MGRKKVEDDPLFQKYAAEFAPLKVLVAQARADAEASIRAAKERVRVRRNALVREMLDDGLSMYAVGKLTGFTSAEAKERLLDEVLGADWRKAVEGGTVAIDPARYMEGNGWSAVWEFTGKNVIDVPSVVVHYSAPNGEKFDIRRYGIEGRQGFDPWPEWTYLAYVPEDGALDRCLMPSWCYRLAEDVLRGPEHRVEKMLFMLREDLAAGKAGYVGDAAKIMNPDAVEPNDVEVTPYRDEVDRTDSAGLDIQQPSVDDLDWD